MTRLESTRRSTETQTNRPGATNAANQFLENAMKFRGQPYSWGGGHGATMNGPGRVDCSGLVQQAARQAGINLDGTAAAQQRMGHSVSMNDLKPGDLVFRGNPAHHVGIYIGNGQVLHAPKTGDVVRIVSVSYFQSARRVFDDAGSPVNTAGMAADPAPTSGGGGSSSGGGSPSGGAGSAGGSDSAAVSGNSRPSSMSLGAQEAGRQAAQEIEKSNARIRAAAQGGANSGLANVDSQSPGNFAALMGKLGAAGVSPEFLQGLSAQYGVPLEMILAVVNQESGGDPNAQSPAGAQGLMQLMPDTARGLGVENSMDPKQNVEGGVKYLGQMLKQFNGDTQLALAAYNAGPGNVQKHGGIPPFAETQNYVARITASMSNTATA